VVKPRLALRVGADIAILIEERKGIAVLQHANALIGQTGIRQDMVRLAGVIFHQTAGAT